VEQDGADDDIIGEIKGGFVLGSEEFAQEARQHVGRDRMGSIDHARRERYIGRPGLDKLFADAKTGKDRRDEAIRQACLDHGYKLTEAARAASLHVSVVSRILRIKDKVQNAKNKT
jgi:DNA invertase Pin-like site-specific DNA recombinase